MQVSRQLGMFRREAAASTLGAAYVPILLAKRGERIALERITPEAWSGITPWLRIVPPELRGREEHDVPPDAEIARVARVARDQAVYLDAAGTPRRSRRIAPLGAAYVQQVFETAVASSLAFAPVYPFGRPDLADSVRAFGGNQLGAAVLVTSDVFVWGSSRLQEALREETRALGIDPGLLDLMLDLRYLPPGPVDTSSVLWLVRQTTAAAPWRSLILAATSVPDSLAEAIPDDSVNAIERREVQVFGAVQSQLAIRLRFSDYAVQHPLPPAHGAAPKMKPSIRYTAGGYMFVSRGGRPIGELSRDEVPEHYRELAERLRQHPPFVGRECCWGDLSIEELADGRIVARGQHMMRAVATCHHLTVVARERLAPRSPVPERSGAVPQRGRVSAVRVGR